MSSSFPELLRREILHQLRTMCIILLRGQQRRLIHTILRKSRALFTQFQQILRTELGKLGENRRTRLRQSERGSFPKRRLDHFLEGDTKAPTPAQYQELHFPSTHPPHFLPPEEREIQPAPLGEVQPDDRAPFLSLVGQLHPQRNSLFRKRRFKGGLVFLIVLRTHDLLQKPNKPNNASRGKRGNRSRRRFVYQTNRQWLVQRRKTLCRASRGNGLRILTLGPEVGFVGAVLRGRRPKGPVTNGSG